MRKGSLLGALEALEGEELEEPGEGENPEVEVEDDGLEAEMLAIMEEEETFGDDVAEVDDVDKTIDQAEAATERLEALVNAIRKHGICAGMMEAVDPHRELVDAGICRAYEELSDVPVQDEEAEQVAEGITTAVAVSAGKAIAANPTTWAIVGLNPLGYAAASALAIIAGLMIKFGPAVKRAMDSHRSSLESAEKKLAGGGSFDETKFGDASANVYTKAEFQTAVKTGEHLIAVVNADSLLKIVKGINGALASEKVTAAQVAEIAKKAGDVVKGLSGRKEVADIFGIEVKVDDNGSIDEVGSVSPTVKPEKKALKELGWKAGDAHTAVSEALGLTNKAEAIEKQVEETVKTCKEVVDTLKSKMKKGVEVSDEEKAAFKQALGDIKKIVAANKTLIKQTISGIYQINGTAMRVAEIAAKAKTKAEA